MSDLYRKTVASLAGGLDRVTPARLYLIALVTALIILHGLWPGRFAVDGETLGLLGFLLVIVLVPLLRSASLPGGTGLNFREDLDQLQSASARAVEDQEASTRKEGEPAGTSDAEPGSDGAATTTAASPGRLAGGDSAELLVTEILREASRSPRVGLILLGSELERAVRHLLLASGWKTSQSLRSRRQGVDRLVELGVLTASAASALSVFSVVRNEIVHGTRVATDAEILRAVDVGIPLLRAVLPIPRERHVVYRSNVPLYADQRGETKLQDVVGVMFETLSPGGAKISYQIFPTTRPDYETGKEVAWEWGSRQWGAAWYRNPSTDAVEQAWLGSTEFVGRHLDDGHA